ncbi:MAG TPA: hypothetical protein VF240_11920 [Pyrinomonadaceae bacterium]
MTNPRPSRTSTPYQLFLLPAVLLLIISIISCGNSESPGPIGSTSGLKSNTRVSKPPAVNVFENEPLLKGSQAVIGGTIQNVSNQKLTDLIVEVELTGRVGGGRTLKEMQVTPASISPGETGSYSLTISNREWAASKIVRLRSLIQAEEVAFNTLPGAKRPPERTPEGKTIIVQKPKPKGEEFINSPDDADPIR